MWSQTLSLKPVAEYGNMVVHANYNENDITLSMHTLRLLQDMSDILHISIRNKDRTDINVNSLITKLWVLVSCQASKQMFTSNEIILSGHKTVSSNI